MTADPNTDAAARQKMFPVCSHYKIKCHIESPCCHRIFGCRLCHDDAIFDHKIDRYAISHVICTDCHTKQPVSNICIKCGIVFANYFCNECNLWCEDPIFHCSFCRICYKENTFHCNQCGVCFVKDHAHDHNNNPKNRDRDETCCICLEPLFFHVKPMLDLLCGHSVHQQCWTLANMIQCPLCKKTGVHVDWNRVDEWVKSMPITDTAIKEVRIFCNDCLHTSTVLANPYGHKCATCGSYNSSMA